MPLHLNVRCVFFGFSFRMLCIFYWCHLLYHASCIYLFQFYAHVGIITKCKHTELLSGTHFSLFFSLSLSISIHLLSHSPSVFWFDGNWFVNVCIRIQPVNTWKSSMNPSLWLDALKVVARIRDVYLCVAIRKQSQTKRKGMENAWQRPLTHSQLVKTAWF